MRVITLFAVLLLAACSGAPVASPIPAASPSPATSPSPAASPSPAMSPPAASASPLAEWRVLADGLSLPELPFAVRVALSAAEFELLWDELGQADSLPSVDFQREVVLYMGISGSSSCPNVLDRLVVDHQNARVYGDWRPVEQGPCTDDLAPQGVLLAVQRDVLPNEVFMLSLRDQPICPDCPTHPDRLLVDPSATGSP